MRIRECKELDTQIGSEFSAHREGGSEVLQYSEALEHDLSSVRLARHKAEALMEEASAGLRESAVLLLSELVTNALIHTSGEVAFSIHLNPGWVRVEVDDSSTRRLQRKVASPSSPGGRGLELVDLLSTRWGVVNHPQGKKVWFELDDDSAASLASTPRRFFRVVLPSAPVSVVIQTLEHVDQVLREVLVQSEGDSEFFARTSEVELSELSLQARAALSRGLDAIDMHMSLPASAAETALMMLSKLEEADSKAASGLLLSPPPSSEICLCRRWILTEIADQVKPAQAPLVPSQTTHS